MAKRILIYTNHFYPENFKVNEIASLLSEEHDDITVVTCLPNYPSGRFYKGYGFFDKSKNYKDKIRVHRLPLVARGKGSKPRLVLNYLSYSLSCFLFTTFILSFKKKYDIVFVHHTSPILIAFPPIILKWLRGSKMILWDLDMWPETLIAMKIIQPGRIANLLETTIKWLYNQYDHILLGSFSFIENAKKRVPVDKVSYFPNWAERVFTENKSIEETTNFTFPDGFKIMYTGNIGEAQDFESILKAIEIVKNEDISWIFIGDGRRKKWFENELKTKNLNKKVHFFGNHPIESIPYFLSKSDAVFLSLKDKELFSKTVPAKLQTYMASSRPILGMISGEGNEIIKKADCGMIAESADFTKFAKYVLDAKNMPQEEIKRLGENGKNYYDVNFSIDNRKKQLLELLNIV